jgi:hypothetical protein
MKKLILVGIVLLFAFGWYSDYREKQKQAQRDRENAEMFGAFLGGVLKGATEE